MEKIIVIQCSNGKQPDAGSFGSGKIKFVANPEPTDKLTFRPDDLIPDMNVSWRDYVLLYNKKEDNPDNLYESAKLYKNQAYQDIIDAVGIENTYILSAGWGLVQGTFRIPKYDITFSASGGKKKRRKKNDKYYDFNQLKEADFDNKEIHFFGGKEYLNLFYDLTRCVAERTKVVIHHATDIEKHPEYSYEKYPRCFTNWHYQAVKDFLV